MMKKIFLGLTFLLIIINVIAQNNGATDFSKKEIILPQGKIRIYQDEVIKNVLRNDINEGKRKKSFRGYRIQIFSGNSSQKSRAIATQSKFKERFGNINTYLKYNAPTFRVRVGNFRSKLEAARYKYVFSQYYPNCYIVNEEIKFHNLIKKVEDTNSEESEEE